MLSVLATPLRVKNVYVTSTMMSAHGKETVSPLAAPPDGYVSPAIVALAVLSANREEVCGLTDGPVRPYAVKMHGENIHRQSTTP